MPELIEVESYRQLAAQVVGERIVDASVLDPRYRRDLPEGAVETALAGAAIVGAGRRGKLLWLDTDRVRLGLRFGMTGRLVVDGEGPIDRLEYGPHDAGRWIRFTLSTASGRTLAVDDARRFGSVELDPDPDALGPDAATVSVKELREALDGGRGSLKARLLDQSRVAGLGNLLTDEALWRAGLAPGRAAGDLTKDEEQRLARTIRSTVRELTRRGGSHTGDLQPARDRAARCPRDGTPVRVEQIGGRTTVWCPTHQR